MEVKARLRYLRMSPRKVRLVIDMVRGTKVSTAVHQLTFSQKEAAKPVLKLLQSAMANAAHNHKLDTDTLSIKTITADGGPTLYRWMPRAHGRATPLRKRTTHITLILTDGKVVTKEDAQAARPLKKAKGKKTLPAKATTSKIKPSSKSSAASKSATKSA